jgi:hypothetical protein
VGDEKVSVEERACGESTQHRVSLAYTQFVLDYFLLEACINCPCFPIDECMNLCYTQLKAATMDLPKVIMLPLAYVFMISATKGDLIMVEQHK